MDKHETNLGHGSNYLVKTSKPVIMWDSLTIFNEGRTVQLDVKVEADLDTIPEEYQEMFVNMMTSKYYGKASFGDNPFSQCVPTKTKRWWQIWK